MKKIILLMLPLSLLMAIDFTMTKDGLYPDKTTEEVQTEATSTLNTIIQNDTSTSKYLEPVNLPECDANNPEVQFIKIDADWSTINNANKSIFCVSPGDYRSLGNIKLTASGTAAKRRYIVLNNGNNLHTGQLDIIKLANFTLDIRGSYWTIDRMASVNSTRKTAVIFRTGKYNILNRAFVSNSFEAVIIRDGADNNTIQKCRFQNPKAESLNSDQAGITTMEYKADSYTIKNTKIIDNEIVNYNDGIQLNRNIDSSGGPLYQNANCEGTIIDGNDIYANDAIASTGENCLDFKVGSDNALNPVVVTNNHLWGYKGARVAGDGTLVVAHYSPKNLHINNNVLFEAGQSIVTGSNGPISGFRYGMIDGEIGNNLIYGMVQKTGAQYTLKASSILTTDIHDNKFINCESRKGFFAYNGNKNYFRNNILIRPVGEYNAYSNGSLFTESLDKNTEYTDTISAGYTNNYSFETDNFTNSPRVITLVNAVKSGM